MLQSQGTLLCGATSAHKFTGFLVAGIDPTEKPHQNTVHINSIKV